MTMPNADPLFDVIVIGYGFAGAVAAISAHDAGARVLLLEKNTDAGGISVVSAGGLRISNDAAAAFAYLVATNAGTSSETLSKTLAAGMVHLTAQVRSLCEAVGATLGVRDSPANYPLPGYESFGFAYVDQVPDFDPAAVYPAVRGSPAGARLFEVVKRNVVQRAGITVRLGTAVERVVMQDGRAVGVVAPGASCSPAAALRRMPACKRSSGPSSRSCRRPCASTPAMAFAWVKPRERQSATCGITTAPTGSGTRTLSILSAFA
jgi:succinate dehydrogenase/fumarate reductase flavoprotein subunit